jgi:hypothetical protein
MDEKEFLEKLDSLYREYDKTNKGDTDFIPFSVEVASLLIEYKGGEL